jgi:hypothetical protein
VLDALASRAASAMGGVQLPYPIMNIVRSLPLFALATLAEIGGA